MLHARKTLSCSTILDFKVENSAGENIGKIEEVMIDLQTGHVAYAVLSFGGFMGMGDKFFPIPWSKLTPASKEKTFILNVPKEKLEAQRGFDKDRWPDVSDPDWRTETYRHYGANPYWEDTSVSPL
jgi:sporulation protein YlmC with PRC-barrel domain